MNTIIHSGGNMTTVSELHVDLDILEDEATHDPHCWQLRNIMMSVLGLHIKLDQRPQQHHNPH